MGTDVIGLGLALAAIQLASKPKAGQRTYGTYRLEILAAVVNGLLLFGVAGYILFQAYRRLADPPEVLGAAMLAVAVGGLTVNIISYTLLRKGASESLNVKGASLEVLSDLVGSIGVIAAAIIIATTGWPYADPIVAALIGLFVLPRTYNLMKQAVRILLEAAPEGVDVAKAEKSLGSIPGVAEVHDLHIWTITSGIEAASVHLMIKKGADWHQVLDKSRRLLADEYGVTHPTVQVEPLEHQETVQAV